MSAEARFDIRPNPNTGCYEAWSLDLRTGERRLVSTCSLCVPAEQFRWWSHHLAHHLHEDEPSSLPTAA